MTFYIFKRNKESGLKKIVKEVETIEEAREICSLNENKFKEWLEFTSDIEYTNNGGLK